MNTQNISMFFLVFSLKLIGLPMQVIAAVLCLILIDPERICFVDYSRVSFVFNCCREFIQF